MTLSDFLNNETLAEQPTPVRGTGGGLADAVPAMVDNQEPAALSEGEFVIPADVISMLGDGSSEAGARIMNKLVETIRASKQGGDKKQSMPISELLTQK